MVCGDSFDVADGYLEVVNDSVVVVCFENVICVAEIDGRVYCFW